MGLIRRTASIRRLCRDIDADCRVGVAIFSRCWRVRDFGDGQSFYVNLHYITSDTTIAMNYDWGQQLLANIVGVMVPAPGTAALLGVACCFGRRRRRK